MCQACEKRGAECRPRDVTSSRAHKRSGMITTLGGIEKRGRRRAPVGNSRFVVDSLNNITDGPLWTHSWSGPPYQTQASSTASLSTPFHPFYAPPSQPFVPYPPTNGAQAGNLGGLRLDNVGGRLGVTPNQLFARPPAPPCVPELPEPAPMPQWLRAVSPLEPRETTADTTNFFVGF